MLAKLATVIVEKRACARKCLVAGSVQGLAVMAWSCSFSVDACQFWGWIYDYQGLITGCLAVLAAGVGIWAPIYLHFRSERDRQIGRINANMLHITALGVHAARWVRLLKSSYLNEDLENTVELAIPNLRRDIARLEEAIKVAHETVVGPDGKELARFLWRVTNMRLAADNAADLANVIEINLRGVTKREVTASEFDEIERHLSDGMSIELPIDLQTIQ